MKVHSMFTILKRISFIMGIVSLISTFVTIFWWLASIKKVVKREDEKMKHDLHNDIMEKVAAYYKDGQKQLTTSMIWPLKDPAIVEIGYTSLTAEYLSMEAYTVDISQWGVPVLSFRILKTGEELERDLQSYLYRTLAEYRGFEASMSTIEITRTRK